MRKISWLLVTLLICFPTLALAAGAIDGGSKQAVNWAAIGMFIGFVSLTLAITYWASKRTVSAADFYSAGGGITAGQVNEAFAAAGSGPMAGILRYSTDPIVSRDVIGDSASCVFDSPLTQASGTLVKVFGWYDNEWGYTCRLADLAALVGGRL